LKDLGAGNAHLRRLAATTSADAGAQVADRLLLVTSARRREGKSLVAAQLGRLLAESGHRTLVVDGDHGRGRLHEIFGFRPSSGLSEVLRGERAPGAVRETGVAGLSVLLAGEPRASDSEAGDAEQFAKASDNLAPALIGW
jgi:tyrosine-protein kinase Etk/Wzc